MPEPRASTPRRCTEATLSLAPHHSSGHPVWVPLGLTNPSCHLPPGLWVTASGAPQQLALRSNRLCDISWSAGRGRRALQGPGSSFHADGSGSKEAGGGRQHTKREYDTLGELALRGFFRGFQKTAGPRYILFIYRADVVAALCSEGSGNAAHRGGHDSDVL